MVIYGLLVVGSFGLAAGGSWYLSKPDEATEEQTDEKTEGAEEAEDGKSVEKPEADPDAPAQDPQPSAMQPRGSTAEDLVRIGVIMSKREQELAKREAELNKIAERQKLIMLDIDAEQRVTDGILSQMRGTLDSSQQVLRQIAEKKVELEAMQPAEGEADETADGAATTQLAPEAQAKNIKNLAEMYKNFEPGRAATILTSMANEGATDQVVKLVNQLDKKKAAQVLDSMAESNPELVVQITKKLAVLPQSAPAKKRR